MNDPFSKWLESIPSTKREELAREYAKASTEAGAFVVRSDGTEQPIPPILAPLSVARNWMAQVSVDAHRLVSALVRLTEAIMSDESSALRKRLFGSFGPLESLALAETWREAQNLATVRVDYLVDSQNCHRALEVNATIPAMQGYSDAIAESFLRTIGRARSLSEQQIESLIDSNGRNADDLVASLLAHYARLGGPALSNKGLVIAIVARAGDAQRGELEHYSRRWSQLGHQVFLATPEQVQIREGVARIRGLEPDLIYRHVFARRIDPTSDFARICLEPVHFRILNPIASHLEVKGMLALLSEAAAGKTDRFQSSIGLSLEERDTIARTVPWTRLLSDESTVGPDGERIMNLAEWAVHNQGRLVLKRSWDYGGRSVFIGGEKDATVQGRLAGLINAGHWTQGVLGWEDLIKFALADREPWVAQEQIRVESQSRLRVDPDGVHARPLYNDLSAFTNLGVSLKPQGGAVRCSESKIVNILSGGGLAPLVFDDVLSQLLS